MIKSIGNHISLFNLIGNIGLNTIKIIDKAHQENLLYLGIDFHDRYFSHSFNTWLNWYMWLVEYLKSNKIEFVNYDMAIKELEKK